MHRFAMLFNLNATQYWRENEKLQQSSRLNEMTTQLRSLLVATLPLLSCKLLAVMVTLFAARLMSHPFHVEQ